MNEWETQFVREKGERIGRLAGLKEAALIIIRASETDQYSDGVAALIAIRARIAELEKP